MMSIFFQPHFSCCDSSFVVSLISLKMGCTNSEILLCRIPARRILICRGCKRKFSMIETVKNRVEQIVEQACAADANIFGYDICTHHRSYIWLMFITEWELMKVGYGSKRNYNGVGRNYEKMSRIFLETDTKPR